MIIPIKEQSGEEKRITLYKTNAFVDALVLFFKNSAAKCLLFRIFANNLIIYKAHVLLISLHFPILKRHLRLVRLFV